MTSPETAMRTPEKILWLMALLAILGLASASFGPDHVVPLSGLGATPLGAAPVGR